MEEEVVCLVHVVLKGIDVEVGTGFGEGRVMEKEGVGLMCVVLKGIDVGVGTEFEEGRVKQEVQVSCVSCLRG